MQLIWSRSTRQSFRGSSWWNSTHIKESKFYSFSIVFTDQFTKSYPSLWRLKNATNFRPRFSANLSSGKVRIWTPNLSLKLMTLSAIGVTGNFDSLPTGNRKFSSGIQTCFLRNWFKLVHRHITSNVKTIRNFEPVPEENFRFPVELVRLLMSLTSSRTCESFSSFTTFHTRVKKKIQTTIKTIQNQLCIAMAN